MMVIMMLLILMLFMMVVIMVLLVMVILVMLMTLLLLMKLFYGGNGVDNANDDAVDGDALDDVTHTIIIVINNINTISAIPPQPQ